MVVMAQLSEKTRLGSMLGSIEDFAALVEIRRYFQVGLTAAWSSRLLTSARFLLPIGLDAGPTPLAAVARRFEQSFLY